MVPILVQSIILLTASLANAEVIAGTNFEAKNWNLILNFREGAGLVTNDSSTNTITVDLTNGPTWVSGKTGRGNAVNFDGSNDLLTVSLSPVDLFDFNGRSTFTVVVLFTNPTGGDDRILASKVAWPNTGWVLRTGASGAKLGLYLRGSAVNYQYLDAIGITNAMFINDRWHTVAFVYRGKLKGTELKELWFDGVSYPLSNTTGSGVEDTLSNDVNLAIGNTNDLLFSNYVDKIGCVMVSRDGYAPDATGMMSLHRRLMGQVSNGAK